MPNLLAISVEVSQPRRRSPLSRVSRCSCTACFSGLTILVILLHLTGVGPAAVRHQPCRTEHCLTSRSDRWSQRGSGWLTVAVLTRAHARPVAVPDRRHDEVDAVPALVCPT